jgi:pyruvate/2-oxoacid:ferredoxin oxidoreductase beta subunit
VKQTPSEKQRCPDCGEFAGVEILFGMPSREAMEAAARGEIALGGCIIPWKPLHYRCLACNWEWGKSEAPVEAGP